MCGGISKAKLLFLQMFKLFSTLTWWLTLQDQISMVIIRMTKKQKKKTKRRRKRIKDKETTATHTPVFVLFYLRRLIE